MEPTHAYANGVEHQVVATHPAKKKKKKKTQHKTNFNPLHTNTQLNKMHFNLSTKKKKNLHFSTTYLKLLCFGNRAFLKY